MSPFSTEKTDPFWKEPNIKVTNAQVPKNILRPNPTPAYTQHTRTQSSHNKQSATSYSDMLMNRNIEIIQPTNSYQNPPPMRELNNPGSAPRHLFLRIGTLQNPRALRARHNNKLSRLIEGYQVGSADPPYPSIRR
ncbi:hypothetical protein CEXT_625121 [Caerostris extrusa]|uniref:Uncharacterized protein n=1 Tax=Caerostris extrusa TaxID=172846 RepID=A0AAV4XQF2_CAEEX|nr:hypothetical protein CEXT_625121 [Caerostris extrusa]